MFETEPFRYLGKPLEEEQFNRYLEEALKRIRERLCYYTYTTGHSTCRVPVRDIFILRAADEKLYFMGKTALIFSMEDWGKYKKSWKRAAVRLSESISHIL